MLYTHTRLNFSCVRRKPRVNYTRAWRTGTTSKNTISTQTGRRAEIVRTENHKNRTKLEDMSTLQLQSSLALSLSLCVCVGLRIFGVSVYACVCVYVYVSVLHVHVVPSPPSPVFSALRSSGFGESRRGPWWRVLGLSVLRLQT